MLLLLTGEDASTDGHIASEGALLVDVVACTQQPARRPNTHVSVNNVVQQPQGGYRMYAAASDHLMNAVVGKALRC